MVYKNYPKKELLRAGDFVNICNCWYLVISKRVARMYEQDGGKIICRVHENSVQECGVFIPIEDSGIYAIRVRRDDIVTYDIDKYGLEMKIIVQQYNLDLY